MQRSSAIKPTELAYYEGLVRKTASMYERIVEDDYEDLCQLFRIKAWRALETYDPSKSSMPVERYVFSCIRNQVKDVLKKKRRGELFIEDLTGLATDQAEHQGGGGQSRDRFDARYLMVREDEAYADLNLDAPLIPSTLTTSELSVVALLYADFGQAEIALRLSMTKREVAASVKSIREKMADWRPSAEAPVSANGRCAEPARTHGDIAERIAA